MALKLNTCSFSDLSRILALADVIWKPTFSPILTEERLNYLFNLMYNRDKIQELLANPDIDFFILQDNDIDVGYAQLVMSDNWVKLEKINLLPIAQGKGYGLYLLNRLIDHALNRGCEKMQLQVNRSNSKAVDFYRKFGFVIIEERDFDVGGGHVMDDYVMSINLKKH